jgi:hypothetical protein
MFGSLPVTGTHDIRKMWRSGGELVEFKRSFEDNRNKMEETKKARIPSLVWRTGSSPVPAVR